MMKNLPTLKGVFPTTKPTSSRNFLKENKLRLKELQSQTSIKKLQEHQQKGQQDKNNVKRRVTSVNNTNVKTKSSNNCACISTKTQNRSSKICTNQKMVQYDDKGTQTDDIFDEQFLSNALERCLSKDTFKGNLVHNADFELPLSRPLTTENGSIQTDRDNQNSATDRPVSSNLNSNLFRCSEANDENKTGRNHTTESNQSHKTMQNCNTTQQNENKNKVPNRLSNIKLPKYLEREKREKELQRINEMGKDPKCPRGFYALDDKERLETLEAAKDKFQKLVNELNRMPLTCQTLRQRSRKIEIEKELTDLEKTIQIFSKPKIYIREDE